MIQKPPSSIPSQLLPLVDPVTGQCTDTWYGAFTNIVSPTTPITVVTLGPSPFELVAVHAGYVLIVGGTVTQLGLIRARVTIADIGQTSGFVPVSQGDIVVITYAVAPNVWHIPNGNPS